MADKGSASAWQWQPDGLVVPPTTTSVPGQFDVLLGRGKGCQMHPGNKRFKGKTTLGVLILLASWCCEENRTGELSTRTPYTFVFSFVIIFPHAAIINRYSDRYFSALTKEKKAISIEIVNFVSETGRFLKEDKSRKAWQVVSSDTARIKVAHSLQYHERRQRPSSVSLVSAESFDRQSEPSITQPPDFDEVGVQQDFVCEGSLGSRNSLENLQGEEEAVAQEPQPDPDKVVESCGPEYPVFEQGGSSQARFKALPLHLEVRENAVLFNNEPKFTSFAKDRPQDTSAVTPAPAYSFNYDGSVVHGPQVHPHPLEENEEEETNLTTVLMTHEMKTHPQIHSLFGAASAAADALEEEEPETCASYQQQLWFDPESSDATGKNHPSAVAAPSIWPTDEDASTSFVPFEYNDFF